MKDLIIIGKAPINKDISELKKQNNELWLCGTDTRKGGDLYFELHNIIVDHVNVIYSLPEEVYEMGFPVNNTISAMLIYAYIKGYKNIKTIGAPMVANDEYSSTPCISIYCWLLKWERVKRTLGAPSY